LLGRVAGILRLLLLALDEIGAVISADIRRRAGGGSVGGLGLRFRLRGLIGRCLGFVRVPFGLLVGRLLIPLGALDCRFALFLAQDMFPLLQRLLVHL